MPKRDNERAARILVDAQALGDTKAAAKWKVSVRTVENYRAALRSDAQLAAIFGKLQATADRSWHAARAAALRAIMIRIEELAQTEPDLDKVARAAKAVGDVDIASSALNVSPRDDRQGSAPPENAGGFEGEGADSQVAH